VLRGTTSRGLCGLVCPSRTSERWVCVYYCSTYYKAVRVGVGPVRNPVSYCTVTQDGALFSLLL
jgi:hypothetical protein